ncbi:MAG: sigma-70 family RNA polymerase sigma factor [Gaiellaceae bacterium MAG52_C11]|nr:sigma-70 family RNA polymerase sigma factor [Candidatus Gaiellasilicea maunaloa]
MAIASSRTDAALVGRLRERDRTAWEDVYAAYGQRLRSFAYRLTGNPSDADDLVQETFVRALPRLDRLDPATVELGPYLFMTLRNLFLKGVERGQRVAPVAEVPEPEVPAPIDEDPERGTLLRSQQEEVRIANARLPARQRLVLALRELEDRSYAEIGEVVGLKENAVAQLISRARESLRTELRLAQIDPARLPEECRRLLPLLSRHLDGQLRGGSLAETLGHLEACDRCQDALDSMREAQRRYRAFIPPIGDGEAHAARIDAELTAAGYWSGRRRGLERLGRRGAVVAVVAALAIIGSAGVGAALLVSRPKAEVTLPVSQPPSNANGPQTTAISTVLPAGTTNVAPRTTTATPARRSKAPGPAPAPVPVPAPAQKTSTRPAIVTAATKTTVSAATSPTTAAASTTSVPATTRARTPPIVVSPPSTTIPPPPKKTTTSLPVDRIAPTVTLTARPPDSTTETAATFSFQANEAGVTFSCGLDDAGLTPCTSPRSLAALAPGQHRFSVSARDRAGNVGPPATASWTIVVPDTTAPTVRITSSTTSGSEARFTFDASEPASLACSLDGASRATCASPVAYSGLAPGSHTFAVTAEDAAGNTSAPATHDWTIARPLPDLVVSELTESGFTVANSGAAAAGAFVVSVTLVGTFTFSGLEPGQSASRTWSACRRGTLTAIADRGRSVTESDEDNNARSLASDC